jgi:hypothetical protein
MMDWQIALTQVSGLMANLAQQKRQVENVVVRGTTYELN